MKCQLYIEIINKTKNSDNKKLLKDTELKIIKAMNEKNIHFNKRIEGADTIILHINLAENYTEDEFYTQLYLQYKYIMDLNDIYNKDNIKISIIGLEKLLRKLVFKYTIKNKINIIKLSTKFEREVLTTGFRTTSIERSYDVINKIVYIKSNYIFLLLTVDNWYKQYSDECLVTVE